MERMSMKANNICATGYVEGEEESTTTVEVD